MELLNLNYVFSFFTMISGAATLFINIVEVIVVGAPSVLIVFAGHSETLRLTSYRLGFILDAANCNLNMNLTYKWQSPDTSSARTMNLSLFPFYLTDCHLFI